VPFKYLRVYFPPVQWRFVGAALCLANRFIAKAMSGLVLFGRYINVPIKLR
jgi:hypothetical protein